MFKVTIKWTHLTKIIFVKRNARLHPHFLILQKWCQAFKKTPQFRFLFPCFFIFLFVLHFSDHTCFLCHSLFWQKRSTSQYSLTAAREKMKLLLRKESLLKSFRRTLKAGGLSGMPLLPCCGHILSAFI